MFDYLRARLRQGTPTARIRDELAVFPERYRGRPALDLSRCPDGCRACGGQLPSELIRLDSTDRVAIDVGACLFSPEEAGTCPHEAIRYSVDHRMAASTRAGLVSSTGEIELASALNESARRLFGRSLRLRSVVAGSCNGCESELVALGNVVFDLARFGVQFVASPRHADGLVITGTVNVNMREALERTWAAVPEPRIVIAVGACAINGGPFRGSAATGSGVPPEIPVDLWVPGCPPHPMTIADGLLRLLGRIGNRTG